MNIKIISLVGLLIMGGVTGWFLNGIQDTKEVPIETRTTRSSSDDECIGLCLHSPAIAALPEQALSDEENSGLVFMREEEKLARDVYNVLYDTWGVQIFSNIAQSEQTHTEAVRTILTKYNITDPVTDDTIGVFVNRDLQKLYTDLTAQGTISIEEAFTVGTLVEDLDIADLQKQNAQTDNDDIKLVYENLMRGSRNHLRSFVSQLTSRGVAYEPKYITRSEFDAIIASTQEIGSSKGNSGRGWGKNKQ
jgi:hypothetical protein